MFKTMNTDYGESGSRVGGGGEVEIEKPRLANLLPGLARWSHLALNTVPNELVEVSRELHIRIVI